MSVSNRVAVNGVDMSDEQTVCVKILASDLKVF